MKTSWTKPTYTINTFEAQDSISGCYRIRGNYYVETNSVPSLQTENYPPYYRADGYYSIRLRDSVQSSETVTTWDQEPYQDVPVVYSYSVEGYTIYSTQRLRLYNGVN